MIYKKSKWIFLVVILAFCLVFCVELFSKEKTNKTVIKFSAWGSQSEISYLLPLIKDFEAINPDIKVDFLHIPQNYFQKLHLLFASNLAPDVVFINNYQVKKYVNANLLVDLSVYVDKSQFFPQAIEAFTVKIGGQEGLYAIPRDVSNLVVFYNKTLFDKYKIPYPNSSSTIEDYIKIGLDFKKKSNGQVFGISFEKDMVYWLPYLLSNGVSLLDLDEKKFFSDKLVRESIELYSSLVNEYFIAPQKSDSASLTMAQMFLQQKIAMHLSGRWLVPKYRQNTNFDWDIAPFPKGKVGSVVNIDASGYAISKSTKHMDCALKFVEFLTSKYAIDNFTQSGLIVPARLDSAYSNIFLDNNKPKNAMVFLDAIKTGKLTLVSQDYQVFADKIDKLLEPIFLGKKMVQDVFDN